jgi:DNA-binding GntR family transcriptional regulator
MPLAELAYQQLRTQILACELMPGSPITENATVERLGLGKTPVREAMLRLVQESFLLVTPRFGYTVAPITEHDVTEVFELREIAEVASVDLAIGKLGPTDVERLEQLCAIGYNAEDRDSILRYLALNAEFHRVIASASGNQRLADLVARLLDESQRMIHLGILLRPRSHEAQQEHSALLSAVLEGDAERARSTATQHIQSARAMVMESLASAAAVAR